MSKLDSDVLVMPRPFCASAWVCVSPVVVLAVFEVSWVISCLIACAACSTFWTSEMTCCALCTNFWILLAACWAVDTAVCTDFAMPAAMLAPNVAHDDDSASRMIWMICWTAFEIRSSTALRTFASTCPTLVIAWDMPLLACPRLWTALACVSLAVR